MIIEKQNKQFKEWWRQWWMTTIEQLLNVVLFKNYWFACRIAILLFSNSNLTLVENLPFFWGLKVTEIDARTRRITRIGLSANVELSISILSEQSRKSLNRKTLKVIYINYCLYFALNANPIEFWRIFTGKRIKAQRLDAFHLYWIVMVEIDPTPIQNERLNINEELTVTEMNWGNRQAVTLFSFTNLHWTLPTVCLNLSKSSH